MPENRQAARAEFVQAWEKAKKDDSADLEVLIKRHRREQDWSEDRLAEKLQQRVVTPPTEDLSATTFGYIARIQANEVAPSLGFHQAAVEAFDRKKPLSADESRQIEEAFRTVAKEAQTPPNGKVKKATAPLPQATPALLDLRKEMLAFFSLPNMNQVMKKAETIKGGETLNAGDYANLFSTKNTVYGGSIQKMDVAKRVLSEVLKSLGQEAIIPAFGEKFDALVAETSRIKIDSRAARREKRAHAAVV